MIGLVEEPRRQLSGAAALAACAGAWVLVLAAALLVASLWSRWPGSSLGLAGVSAAALVAVIYILAVSRRRGAGF